MVRLPLVLSVWLGMCGMLTTAHAQNTPATPNFSWVRAAGAESCASEQELSARLSALGSSMEGAAIEGLAMPGSAGFRARIRMLDQNGTTLGVREVESPGDCSALTPALLLVLAWMIDSQTGVHEQTLLAAPPATREAPTSVPAAPAIAPAAPASRWLSQLAFGASIAVAVTPDVSGGPSLGLRLQTPYFFTLAVMASYFVASRIDLPNPTVAGSGVEISAVQGSLAACVPLTTAGSFELSGCWGALLGTRRTRSVGLLDAENPSRLYGGPLSALAGSFRLDSRWSLGLEITGAALGRDDVFTYQDRDDNTQVLFHPKPFAAWTTLSVAARL